MEKNLFWGGLPTEPDVKKIREIFPDGGLNQGDIIKYIAVEEIINCEKGSSRFNSVTNAWRKVVEKETNIILGCEPTVGFKVLTESEKVGLSGSKLRSAARASRRSYVVAARVDITQLSEKEKDRLDHQMSVTAKILASAQIKIPKALPKIS